MATKRRALITGITGQDGSYLSEFLLQKGYEVHGIIRRTSTTNTERLASVSDRIHLHCGDVVDSISLFDIISRVRPHEVYNLAAQSHVKVSFEMPIHTTDSTAVGVLRLLDAIRAAGLAHETRVFQASSSEMFGSSTVELQNEETPFKPCSPYGISKLYGHFTVQMYRSAYGMFCVSGILFNHESPRRGTTFVSRKITMGIASILKLPFTHSFTFWLWWPLREPGEKHYLELGNLDARRDWGHSRDYVKSMWLMLQQKVPKDYVVATGIASSPFMLPLCGREKACKKWGVAVAGSW
ncbi:GDP-mannose 4,6 dehydratase, putative [Eimeria praecox]|uniref:GDP-mannose 4,6-dehydratase n=1 Tax=Eimeria praecox TaxID=51316 RepID=U6G4Y1_9EIME|nr:GDP-mannose 4,6 dehydratase, putative [Eimeria praecox]